MGTPLTEMARVVEVDDDDGTGSRSGRGCWASCVVVVVVA